MSETKTTEQLTDLLNRLLESVFIAELATEEIKAYIIDMEPEE